MRFGTMVMLGAAIVGALAVSGTAWSALPSEMAPAQGASVVVNEVQYDPSPTGGENTYEWVELLNVGSTAVSLEGWTLSDNRASDEIPPSTIGPGEYLVVAGGDGFAELFPDYGGHWVSVGGSIGNGLGNTGDQVRLTSADGTVVDGMSYGEDAAVLNPAAPDVAPGHSLERVPSGADTDTADDWLDQPAPSPGQQAGIGRPTDVPPTVPPPTLPPGARVMLNEHMPAPRDVDWDGDGAAGKDDEWVELYNPGDESIDLRGWQLDDVADGGSAPYVFVDRSEIAPHGYRVVFKRETGLALNNGGDSIRLLAPDGSVADVTEYRNAAPDTSFSRDRDGSGAWTDQLPPSPGQQNGSAGGTPGPGPVPSSGPGPDPSATAEPTDSATPGGPHQTPTAPTPPTAPATPSTPAAPGDVYLPCLLTELMFDPLPSGNDAAFEWVELHNLSDTVLRLVDWSIGDRSGWDALPESEIAARGFLVVAASPQALGSGDHRLVPHVFVADGRIGGGLGNGGDVVRLRGPTGAIVDAVSYGNNIDAFDPAVPIGSPGSSVERLPPDVDSDTADDWWPQPAPSPGRAGQRHEGPPVVRINELLPAPRDVDWDGDGVAGHTDEWIELHNGASYPADLTGWRLVVGEPPRWTHHLAHDSMIPAGGFLLLHRQQTELALGNTSDTLRLLRDDGVVADQVAWTSRVGYDRSWSRTTDGGGEWTSRYAVTPGRTNTPRAHAAADAGVTEDGDSTMRPDPPRLTSLRDVRTVAAGVRAQVRGRVTVAPGVFGDREAYIGGDEGGLKLYLRPKDMVLPTVDEGQAVIATGVLKDYRGERELVLEQPSDLWVDQRVPVVRVEPRRLQTGDLGEHTEGVLACVVGSVTDVSGPAITLDDGTGHVRVIVRQSSDVRAPELATGDQVAVVGVVTQFASKRPWEGGYRLTPRSATDFLSAGAALKLTMPRFWPNTGRAREAPRSVVRASPRPRVR